MHKRLVFILFFMAFSLPGKGQLPAREYYITISQSPINLTYSTALDYENQKLIDKAISVTIRAKSSNYSLYARMERSGGTGTSQIPPNLFFIQIDNINPSHIVVPYTPFYLSTTDQLIHRDYNGAAGDYVYQIDFGVSPLGYSYKAGGYGYNIIFTLTAP